MRELLNGFTTLLNLARGFEGDRRAGEAEDYARMARARARAVELDHLDREASGDLGDATLGTLDDAEAAGLLDPKGWFVGMLDGEFLYNNSDGHHLVYGRPGSGKGTTSAQPNLAHVTGSMLVIDVKDGELHHSSAEHRASTLGHEVFVLDPWGITGQGVRACPLDRIRKIGMRGGRIDDEADDVALMLLPKGKADSGEGGWARKGARRVLVNRIKYLAYFYPTALSLTELWRFFNSSEEALTLALDSMALCGREEIAGPAAAMKSTFLEAPKQFEAYRSECIEALAAFGPGSALAEATAANDFDFGVMKHRPMTVYLSVPSSKLGIAAPWIALMLNHAIEAVAAETGPMQVRFLVDELAQLPAPIPALMKALRLYRGRGILLTMYCQGRFSLRDAGYSDAAIKEIEDQVSCIQMWGVEDPSLLKDVVYWSGTTSIVQVSPTHSDGQVAHGSFGRREEKRPVLQVEDIRRINEGRQIVKMPGYPLFVTDRVGYWRVTPWKSQLRDVRELHFGKQFDEEGDGQ